MSGAEKQTQAKSEHKKEKHRHRNQERKFCFLNTNFILLAFPIDSLMCYLPFTVHFPASDDKNAFEASESISTRQSL